jgi:hypothetical protein
MPRIRRSSACPETRDDTRTGKIGAKGLSAFPTQKKAGQKRIHFGAQAANPHVAWRMPRPEGRGVLFTLNPKKGGQGTRFGG